MTALGVVGYLVLVVGIVLTVLAAVGRSRSAGDSEFKLVGVELKVPASLVVVVVGLAMVLISDFGPRIVDSVAGGQPTTGAAAPATDLAAATAATTPTGTAGATVTVTAPPADAVVGVDGFPVAGTSSLAPGARLWVVYQQASGQNPSYQPQRRPCTVQPGGGFTCDQQFVGGPDDSGQQYILNVVLVTAAGADELLAYDRSDPAARGYPGLPGLPADSVRLATVTVRRA